MIAVLLGLACRSLSHVLTWQLQECGLTLVLLAAGTRHASNWQLSTLLRVWAFVFKRCGLPTASAACLQAVTHWPTSSTKPRTAMHMEQRRSGAINAALIAPLGKVWYFYSQLGMNVWAVEVPDLSKRGNQCRIDGWLAG